MAGTPARPADVINLVINATDDELSGGVHRRGLEHRGRAQPARRRAHGPRRRRGSRIHPRARVAPVMERTAAGSRLPEADEHLRPAPSRPHVASARRRTRAGPSGRRARRTTSASSSRARNARSRIASRPTSISNVRRSWTICALPVLLERSALARRAGIPASVDQCDRRCDDDRRPGRGPRPPPAVKRQGPGAAPSGWMEKHPGPRCSCRARIARQLVTSSRLSVHECLAALARDEQQRRTVADLAERRLQLGRRLHRLPVHLHDDVARLQAGRGRGAVGIHGLR